MTSFPKNVRNHLVSGGCKKKKIEMQIMEIKNFFMSMTCPCLTIIYEIWILIGSNCHNQQSDWFTTKAGVTFRIGNNFNYEVSWSHQSDYRWCREKKRPEYWSWPSLIVIIFYLGMEATREEQVGEKEICREKSFIITFDKCIQKLSEAENW